MSDQLEEQLVALGSDWQQEAPARLRDRVAALAIHSTGARYPIRTKTDGVAWRVRHSVLVSAAVIALVLAVPASREAIARQAYRVLQTLRIAPRTELVTYGSRSADEVQNTVSNLQQQLSTGTRWHLALAYGGFGGSVPRGASARVRKVTRSEDLRALAPIALMEPTALYRGELLTFHHALVAPDGAVFVFCGTGDREVMLFQVPVANGQSVEFSRVAGGGTAGFRGVAPSTETLAYGGQTLTWDPEPPAWQFNTSALRWEHDGISYSLYGRGLTRDEALALFSSLRPLN